MDSARRTARRITRPYTIQRLTRRLGTPMETPMAMVIRPKPVPTAGVVVTAILQEVEEEGHARHHRKIPRRAADLGVVEVVIRMQRDRCQTRESNE